MYIQPYDSSGSYLILNCLYSLQASVHVSQVTVEDVVMNVRKIILAIHRHIAFVSITKWGQLD